jgi:sugar phosphate isomerase/epimerase
MQLGFVSAVFPDFGLEEVLAFAADEGFDCVEVMCWPAGRKERRRSGVCHLDVASLSEEKVAQISDLIRRHAISISGLGYYPNPMDTDTNERRFAIEHLQRVISAAARLEVRQVNTFIGRDPALLVEDNWPMLREVWPEIVRYAEKEQVKLGIENCPMLFTRDHWPGGMNMAAAPAVWRELFNLIPSPHLGLNFDPSHLIWQQIDYVRCIREFGKKILHVHAKDTRVDREKLYDVGVTGLGWHAAKLPGLGEADWGQFFSALTDVGYAGPVCIEVEDRAFEGSLADRKRALRQSKRFLEQFIS